MFFNFLIGLKLFPNLKVREISKPLFDNGIPVRSGHMSFNCAKVLALPDKWLRYKLTLDFTKLKIYVTVSRITSKIIGNNI